MVGIIPPVYRSTPIETKDRVKGVKESSKVETHNEESAGQPYVLDKDRRQRKDRRGSRRDNRSVYDMRSGKGRRKDDPQPSIEITV